MKIFLDTANLEDIKKHAASGLIDGVTTNPSLIAQEGLDIKDVIKEIVKLVDGPISAEVYSTDLEGMLKEGREYAKWHKNICVKLPCTQAGLTACKVLSAEKIKVNMTLVFSVNQALLCAKAGAFLVSPFVGRLDDIGASGMDLIADIVQVYDNYQYPTQILVASVRHAEHVKTAAMYGADIATIPTLVFEKLHAHPLTDIGLEKFLKDANKK